jgi:hypothetical protein
MGTMCKNARRVSGHRPVVGGAAGVGDSWWTRGAAAPTGSVTATHLSVPRADVSVGGERGVALERPARARFEAILREEPGIENRSLGIDITRQRRC